VWPGAALIGTFASCLPEDEETGMTIAEQLRHEGEQRGMLKRREEARLEAIEEGERYAVSCPHDAIERSR
jgi:hypothetical protein